MNGSRPIFTIVTPALKCRELLPRNLASIRGQGLPPGEIEHWVIDGGSTDGTVEYLQSQNDVRFISEKDKGLSDALNKGIQRATGDWVLWLNADDELAPGALPYFKQALREYPDTWLFCGRERIMDYDGVEEAVVEGWDYNLKDLLGMRTSILQASTFAHRRVYEKVGLYDVQIRYAMDYEWIVRAAHHFRCQPLPGVLSQYHRRRGSIMDANMAAHYKTFLHVRRQYHQTYFSLGEWRIRFYLMTEPLRRIRRVRKAVRAAKRLFGQEPAHPM